MKRFEYEKEYTVTVHGELRPFSKMRFESSDCIYDQNNDPVCVYCFRNNNDEIHCFKETELIGIA